MTELERFATALVAQWRSEGGGDNEPIAVSALLDRVLSYRVARRVLGIDASEDYEALMLRLLAEDEGLVRVAPAEAALMAKTTNSEKLPDLGVLQLLRSAHVTLGERVLTLVPDVTAAPAPKPESKWAAEPEPKPAAAPVAKAKTAKATPAPVAAPVAAPAPVAARCWSCSEALPVDRPVKFCVFCGADQRQPTCGACGATAERNWKHCAECGAKL